MTYLIDNEDDNLAVRLTRAVSADPMLADQLRARLGLADRRVLLAEVLEMRWTLRRIERITATRPSPATAASNGHRLSVVH